ncbi:MAG: hypothetical protein RIQ93_3150 [Verrucomicrobiota bacterium]|jgi:uncharacterized protein (TIGR03790 family)
MRSQGFEASDGRPCKLAPAFASALFVLRALTVLAVTLACRLEAQDDRAARVVILANLDDPDSLRIAQHYAAARKVPVTNLISLKLPLGETISWREFIVTLWTPLLARLVRDKWIDAIPMAASDALGRQKYAVYGNRIAALVVCRGVPLKIAHAPELLTEVAPLTAKAEFRTNAGAVDAELSLLAAPNYPITAFVPNVLFQNERPTAFELGQVVKVSRLDGPTPQDAMTLVDRALAAERDGLLGRAYVDLARRDAVGDGWLENVVTQIAALGFDSSVDREPATLSATARFDAPVLYFGWYASDLNGPFALPGFQFPPGAIALHIHSFSASSLRVSNGGWTGPLVARGVTATVGNVYEPYLQFTHRPNLFLRALARGATLVDAAYFSLQALSWQAVLIGDPLYRPFAVSEQQQLDRLGQLPARLSGYAVLRRMRQLDDAKRGDEAIKLAISAQRAVPSLAVGVALAQRLRLANDPEGAAQALGFVPLLRSFRPDEWALAREAANVLQACGRLVRALEAWQLLLTEKTMPPEFRLPCLREASAAAMAAQNPAQSTAWDKEAAELTGEAAKK